MSVPKKEGGPPIEFNNDGSLKSVEIRIVNLQLDVEASKTAQTGREIHEFELNSSFSLLAKLYISNIKLYIDSLSKFHETCPN